MNYQLAIETYQSILNDFAGVHRLQQLAPDTANTNPIIDRAKQLALPAVGNEVSKILSSIMGSLLCDSASGAIGYYLPQEITENQSLTQHVSLPVTEIPTNLAEQHRTLWAKFQNVYNDLLNRSLAAPILEANLYALLQRFCWALPAPVAGATDVSLFDYARVSAAIAVCLAETGADNPEPALLVGADLSGVQEFLYTLSSDGAAKSLRGRSVYLQLLMEVIALDLLHELALPMANLLYVGGGNLYLVASPSQHEQIKTYQKKAGSRLLKMHEGALYLAMAAQPIKQPELRTAKMGDVWGRVADALSIQKAQRFSELDGADMAEAIGSALHGTGIATSSCRVCQRQMLVGEESFPVTASDINSEERKCSLCHSFDQLGSQLSKANYLGLFRVVVQNTDTHQSLSRPIQHWDEGLRRFSYQVHFVKSAGQLKQLFDQSNSNEMACCYFWEIVPDQTNWGKSIVWNYRPLAQCVPLNEIEELETFDTLAANSDGLERWGVLRMDVDRLGTIFQDGMKPNASLSRVVSLSGLMRLFFEGYLPKIAEQFNQPTKPQVHLMYAGGDDLFIVGSWSILPELAKRIRDEFDRFACGNCNVTLSGGISIVPAVKYPLYQAAEDAHRAEQRAKRYGKTATTKAEKNALTLLGETMTWRKGTLENPIYDSYAWVWYRVQELKKWTNGKDAPLSRSFLMNLRAIDAEWREWKLKELGLVKNVVPRYDHKNIQNEHKSTQLFLGPWQWYLVYSLHQAAERTRNRDLMRAVGKLVTHIIAGEIKIVGLTVRWTEFLTRDERNSP